MEDDQEAIQKEKELSNAYFVLSLVDNYSLRDGKIVDRLETEEIQHIFEEAMNEIIEELHELETEGEEEDEETLKKRHELYSIRSLEARNTKMILEKFSLLLYQHSLDTIDVQAVLDRVKKEI